MTSEHLPPLRPRPTSARGRALSLIPGVRAVRAQIGPYAEAWHRENVAALERSGPLWLVVGDSTAQGIGASAFDRGWVGQLRQLMASDGQEWRVINLSQSGGRVRDVLGDQLPLADRLGLEPTLITVAVGANDLRPSRRDGLEPGLEELTAVLPPGTVIGTIPGRPRTVAPFNELVRAVGGPPRTSCRRDRRRDHATLARQARLGLVPSERRRVCDVGTCVRGRTRRVVAR